MIPEPVSARICPGWVTQKPKKQHTEIMETSQNRATWTAVFGECPNFRNLLAVLVQKSSVICDYLLLYN